MAPWFWERARLVLILVQGSLDKRWSLGFGRMHGWFWASVGMDFGVVCTEKRGDL